jgi:hypothetical protein
VSTNIRQTPKQRQPRTKPPRHIGVVVRPSDVNPCYIVRVVEGKKTDHFAVTPLASDYGTAFAVEKVGAGQDPYHVCLAGADSTCDCKGHLHHGNCRHVEGLAALQNAGRL